jgi:ABC-type multidrug transport system fused ATPase/permease subunit
MRRLLPDIKHYRKEIVLAPLFKMIEALLELLVPLIVAAIVDVGIAGGDGGYVLRMSLLLVGLGLAGLLFSVTAQFFAARAAVGYAGRLRSRLFKKMQALPFSTLDRLGAPTMVTRMTGDVNQVQTGVNMGLRLLLRSPFVVFGAMIMAFTVDTRAAVVFAVVIPVLGAVVSAITLLTIPLYRKVQQRLDRVVGLTRENLTGVRVIRAFGQEER